MKMHCEEVQRSLQAWLDRELSQFEAERVESHLLECPQCSEDRRQLERLQDVLRDSLQVRASGLAFEPFWRDVRRRILEQKPWYVQLLEWMRFTLYPVKLTWAIPVVIVLLLLILSLEQFVPGLGLGPGTGNLAAVESIDGHGLNVAVFRESKTKTTVIWIFQNQEGEDEAAEESASGDSTF
jgi:anti-sigma factor RsiW